MLRYLIPAAAALALAGCLETTAPVFDASNAVPVAEQAKFMEFVEFMEVAGEGPAGDPGKSPRELIEQGAFSVDLGDMVLLQSEEDGKYTYMAVGIFGNRAFTCFVAPDDEISTVAQAYGVTIVRQQEQGGFGETMQVEGDKEKVAIFIADQLATAVLICFAMTKRPRVAPQ